MPKAKPNKKTVIALDFQIIPRVERSQPEPEIRITTESSAPFVFVGILLGLALSFLFFVTYQIAIGAGDAQPVENCGEQESKI